MSNASLTGRARKAAAAASLFATLLTSSAASAEEVAFRCSYELGSDTEATRRKVGSVVIGIDADAKIARIDFGKGWFRDMKLAIDGMDVKETGPPASGDDLGFFYFDLTARSGGFAGDAGPHEFFDACVSTNVEKRAEIAPPPSGLPPQPARPAPPELPASPPPSKAPANADGSQPQTGAPKSVAAAELPPAPPQTPPAAGPALVQGPQQPPAPAPDARTAEIAPSAPSAQIATPPPAPVAPVAPAPAPAPAQVAPQAAETMTPSVPASSPEPATPKAAAEGPSPLAAPPALSPAPAPAPEPTPEPAAPVVAEPAPTAPEAPSLASPLASEPPETPPDQPALQACSTVLVAEAQTVKVNFKNFSSEIATDSRGGLKRIAALARACPGVRIEVAGHTDNYGDPDMNKDLSEQRASAVVQFLIAQGAASGSLTAAGYGAERPIASNATAEGRRLNRRVEFRIFSAGAPG